MFGTKYMIMSRNYKIYLIFNIFVGTWPCLFALGPVLEEGIHYVEIVSFSKVYQQISSFSPVYSCLLPSFALKSTIINV